MKRSIILLFTALLASVLPLRAQEAAVAAGDRVRVATAARPPMRGTVVRVDAAGLAIRSGADTVFTPWRDVQRLDLSRGRSPGRSGLTVGAVGLGIGAAGGAAFGHYGYEESDAGDECIVLCTRHENAAFAAVAFGILGAGVGFAAGAIFPPERWRSARVPVRVSVGRGQGVELGARIGF